MKYRTIVADPPWPYTEAFAQLHTKAGRVTKPLPYGYMNIGDIAALPVGTLAEPDARLFLWTTNRFLPDAFAIIAAWGFQYRQTVVWHKAGNPSPWGGSVAPNHAEFLLVGIRGKPERLTMWKTSVVAVNVGRHSEKPALFLDLIEQVSPAPRVEMFARTQRLGWDTWGNEALNHIDMQVNP